ncbi:Crp/Fnr family transcriptional regulator [uncultured Aquimarina sp.]|uniref:Crp/Fnr family transcriptional regulator n=1 Tax=uncultured Aquimarina sp. TaxID=575652 RepID=UPI00261D0323|nr:Crp/Fnr family transcriptional regulator [uncultured Aquimarina sp.]
MIKRSEKMQYEFDKLLDDLKNENGTAFNELQSIFRQGSCKKGETLIEIHKPCTNLYWITSGIVKQYQDKEDGTRYTKWFVFEGDLLSSPHSFKFGDPSSEGAEALEDCKFMYISRADGDALCEKYGCVNTFFRLLAELYFIEANARVFFMQAYSAKEKYDHIMEHNSHMLLRLPQKEIASFLGIRKETLSRIRKYS